MEAELIKRQSQYSDEMKRLRLAEEELRRDSETRRARVEDERRRKARSRESKLRQVFEVVPRE